MRIGITERGDAGIDFSWVEKLNDDSINGAVLITKNMNDRFIYHALRSVKPIIVHCTCTGYGGTALEPNVPDYKTQINKCIDIINKGLNPQSVVLRIDPIFPTVKGIAKLEAVLDMFQKTLYIMGVNRIRVSIVDEYPHVRERYAKHGWPCIYNGQFQASDDQIKMVADMLAHYDMEFEACAETKLASYCGNVKEVGCISIKDLSIMELESNTAVYENPQNRRECHCLQYKTELLTNRRQCPNGCVYCYWK